MKHAIFHFLIAIIGYALWQVTPKPERKRAAVFLAKHGVRIGLLLLCLLALLATAVQHPSLQLF